MDKTSYYCVPEGRASAHHKFKLVHDGVVTGPYTIQDLIVIRPVLYPDTIVLQCLGFSDINNRKIYEGDVLELAVTPELLQKLTEFPSIGLKKALDRHKNDLDIAGISHIVCAINYGQNIAGCQYVMYARKADKTLVRLGSKDGSTAARYLCSKGAAYVGNRAVEPHAAGL